jgi:nucleoside-diphosphate-sugar epimerase
MKNVLITGATGFIGACLARRMISQRIETHILVRPSSGLWRIEDIMGQLVPHTCDLLEESLVNEIIREIQPDVIFHLATNGAYSWQNDADKIIRTNFYGTWNLLRACDQVDYQLFVNAGSSSEYGRKSYAMRETDVAEPGSYYAVAKAAQTMLAKHFANSEKRPIVTLRFFSVFGPYEEPSRLIPTLVDAFLNNKKAHLVSPDTARDFIFIDDALDMMTRVGDLAKYPGEVFNVGTGVQTSIMEVVNELASVTGNTIDASWSSMPPRQWDTDTWVADISKAKKLVGWKPSNSLKSGLEKTVQWHKGCGHRFVKQ